MANTEYNFKALDKVFKMTDAELVHEFLIKKTPEEIKAYDEYMKKLPEDKRKKVVDPFLDARAIILGLKDVAVKNSELLPIVNSIQTIDFAYFAQLISDKYRTAVRNPRKYKLNFEVLLMYYDELLADNWDTFDRERLEIVKYFKSRGETIRTRTPQVNADVCIRLFEAVSSINLDNVYER